MSSEVQKLSDVLGQVQLNFKCEVCSRPCSSQCSHCRKIAYCSKDCQLEHRAVHKLDCFPLKLVKNADNLEHAGVATRDNHWAATRVIKQGEIIFKEKPLLEGPSSSFYLDPHDEQRYEDISFLPLCLSCCKILSMKPNATVNKCSKCKWYMCGPACEKNPCHKMECDLFRKVELTPNVGQRLDYNLICYLRTIFFKSTQPKKWEEVMSLKGAYALALDRYGETEMKLEFEHTMNFLVKRCGFSLGVHVDRDMVLQVMSVWKAYMVEDIYTAKDYSIGRVYPRVLLVSNSCKPNCVSTRDLKGSGNTLLATIDIAAGEPLGRMNIGSAWKKGTYARRRLLTSEGPKFICRCDRCKDPTECGTYFSAIKCPKGCRTGYSTISESDDANEGYILPLNPLNQNSDWKCNNPSCQSRFDWPCVERILKPISSAAKLLLTRATRHGFDVVFRDVTPRDKDLFNEMEQFIEKYKAVIHPNHHLIFEITLKLALGASAVLIPTPGNGVETGDIMISMAEKQKDRALYCLRIADRIQPGFTPVRGKCLWMLAIANWVSLLGFRKRMECVLPGAPSPIEEANQITQQAEDTLKSDTSPGVEQLIMLLTMIKSCVLASGPKIVLGSNSN